jgi:hypothetical protein
MRPLRLLPTLLAAIAAWMGTAAASSSAGAASSAAAAESAQSAPVAAGSGMTFVRVWPQWKDTDAFMSISEYFTHKEMTGGWIVLRTHPESRVGFYFLTRLKNAGAKATGTRFVVRMIMPDSPDPRIYQFAAPIPHGSHLFEIGLTGPDWKGSRLHPVAWRVELQDSAGGVLAAKSSYLWEKPDK